MSALEQLRENPPGFVAFGPSHAIVIALTAALLGWLCYSGRRGCWGRLVLWQNRVLAGALLLAWPLKALVFLWQGDGFVWPMHLCDWAGIAGAVALLRQRQLAAEVVYFWGMAGTLQGLITPDLVHDAPHPMFFVFFLLHSGVVVTALYLVIGLRIRPQPGAVKRMFLCIQAYVLVAALVNVFTGHNYGFLCAKPTMASGSLMDHFGPWPWYILVLEALCLLLFLVLNIPFWLRQREARGEQVTENP